MFINEQIQNLQRRIKNIEQNPRPEYLKCNKLMYEIEMEDILHANEAWQAGKPFAMLGQAGGGALTRALGFEPTIAGGNRLTDPQRYFDLLVSKFGFPEHSCEEPMMGLALLLSGEVPLPKLVVSTRIPCDPHRWAATALAKFAGCLFFELTKPYLKDYESLRCGAEQLEELIEFAEKSIPGIKYDEEELIKRLEMDQQAANYRYETYELRKRVPCPLSPQDCFRAGGGPRPGSSHNPAKVMEYCKMYRDELFERAEKGIGGVPEEKLRIAWLATAPFGRGVFDLLSQKGVSMVWFNIGIAAATYGVIRSDYGDNLYGKKLTPLEETLRMNSWNSNTWAGTAESWVDPLVQVCRELKVDAAVDFLQVGCITTKNLKRITAQRLQEECGIPTLDLEGRQRFTSEAGMIEISKRLEEFLDLCIANKK